MISFQGRGQTFSLDPAFNSYPGVNCDFAYFLFNNNTSGAIWYRLFKSDDGISNWVDISEANSAQKVNASIIKQINITAEGYYQLRYYTTSSPLSYFNSSNILKQGS